MVNKVYVDSHFLMYSGSITKSEDEVSDVSEDIGDGGCRGVHTNMSSSMSIGVTSLAPISRASLRAAKPLSAVSSTTGSQGLAVSFLCISVNVIRAIPIKAYSSMLLPKCLYELIMDYKYSMEQHDRHARVMDSLLIFFQYIRFRRFIQGTVQSLLML